MVRTTAPVESVIVAVTLSAACCNSTPNGVVVVVDVPSVVLVPARSWSPDHHAVTNQACRLQGLSAVNLTGDGTEGGIQFLNAAHGTDLRKLRSQFVVLHWVSRIPVLKLRHQQRQKTALQIGGIASRQELELVELLVLLTPVFVGSFTFTAMDMHVSFTGRE